LDLLEWVLATWAMCSIEVLCVLGLYVHHSLRTPGQRAEALVQGFKWCPG